jgi:hypothetical protein
MADLRLLLKRKIKFEKKLFNNKVKMEKEKMQVLPVQQMNVAEVKINKGQYEGLPKNPRVIKNDKFRKLKNSIQEDPEFMALRPIVVNEENIVLGGNQRLTACIDLGIEEVPVIKVLHMPIEKQKSFIVKDNVSFGDWDLDEIYSQDWDLNLLQNWGVEVELKQDEELTDDEIESKYDDTNCVYPLIPIYDEQYNAVIIICETKTELANVRSKLNITTRRQSYKNKFIGETNIITAKELFQNEESNSKSQESK